MVCRDRSREPRVEDGLTCQFGRASQIFFEPNV